MTRSCRFLFLGFLVSTVLIAGSSALAECKACPYSCASAGLSKDACSDFKNKKGKCCIKRTNDLGPGEHCGTDRRCTKAERKKRGCKDYKNDKGVSCISFKS